MDIDDVINSMEENLRAAYDKVKELKGTIPRNKNLENLAAAILSIPLEPTIANLKKALATGTEKSNFPIGSEIPDTYDGNDNPLIVAQYLNSTNNETYGGAEGAILIRKYPDPLQMQFGTNLDDKRYPTALIKKFIDTTYLDNCSAELKKYISPIDIQWEGTVITGAKWFLMSALEVGTTVGNTNEGFFWDIWKQRTGLSSPNNMSREGRIVRDRNGEATRTWLRSLYNGTTQEHLPDPSLVCLILDSGSIIGVYPSAQNTLAILPACFISK